MECQQVLSALFDSMMPSAVADKGEGGERIRRRSAGSHIGLQTTDMRTCRNDSKKQEQSGDCSVWLQETSVRIIPGSDRSSRSHGERSFRDQKIGMIGNGDGNKPFSASDQNKLQSREASFR